MAGARLSEQQAKQLADRRARQSRSSSKWGYLKWALVGTIFAFTLVILVKKRASGNPKDTLLPEPEITKAPEDMEDVGYTIKEEESTEAPKAPAPPPLEEEESANSPPNEMPDISHEVANDNAYWGLNQEGNAATTTTVPAASPSSNAPSAPPTEEEITGGQWSGGNVPKKPTKTTPSPTQASTAGSTVSSTDESTNSSTSESMEDTPSDSAEEEELELEEELEMEEESAQEEWEELGEEALEALEEDGVDSNVTQPVGPPALTDDDDDDNLPTQTNSPTARSSTEAADDDNLSDAPTTRSPSAAPTEEEIKGGIWDPAPDKKETEPSTDENNPEQEEETTSSPTASSTMNDEEKYGDQEEEEEEEEMEEEEENGEGPSPSQDEQEEELPHQSTSPTVPYQYRKRGRPISKNEAKELADKWGSWTLKDTKSRPTEDYCGDYPNRDIPWAEFPKDAWQTDEKYVKEFLKEGKDLVMRAMEVHLAEYGFGPDDMPGEDFESRRDRSPFLLEIKDHLDDEERRLDTEVQDLDDEERRRLSTGVNDRAGWAPQKSFDGLTRRLLHAVVSGSDFNLVLGGHSAAAGHGNHFQQSYTLQFQRVMEPVLARLGVKHYSRNTGMGGLGTIQSVMGARDIYGSDVDILIWDSSMTESSGSSDFDLFARQGILGSDRAPMLWAGIDEKKLFPLLQQHADIDFMMYGTGMGPIPAITDAATINDIPWAARYLKCNNDFAGLCKDNKYNGTCWIDRSDFVPWTPQNDGLGGKATWHEGNRVHQLYGRTLSFTVLRALYEALDYWDYQPQHELSDHVWHMTEYYENIQSKIASLDPSIGMCHDGADKNLSTAFCSTTFQARSEFTPRANPAETSIRSIMKPFGPDANVPQPELNIYEPPDVYNPILGVPEGEVDYLAIIENGVDYELFAAPNPLSLNTRNRLVELPDVDDNGEAIVPGLGWGINTKASPHQCNGTYDSFCGRAADHACLLYAHNDYRGGLSFDSLSGWGIFTLTNLKKGMVFVKMDSWRKAKQNPVTEGWTEVNNGTDVRALGEATVVDEPQPQQGKLRQRRTKKKDPNAEFCDDFSLEFAFGDQIVRIGSKDILGDRHALVQRVVQIWTVLDDPDFIKDDETIDLELGIRLLGCQRQHVFWLSTIYWA